MNWTRLEENLIRDEGLRLRKYPCSEGHPTIGVGHKLRPHERDLKEVSLIEAGRLLRLDISDAITDLEALFAPQCLDRWTEPRQRALVNMAFNLGRTRLSGFRKMIAAINSDDWPEAARQCLDSKYARQVGERAVRIATALRFG